MSARTWLMARLTGALVLPERAELELDEYRDEVRAEDAAEIAALRSQVAELLVERHSTNEVLDDAIRALREQRDQITKLEARLGREAEQRHLMDPLDHALEALAPRSRRKVLALAPSACRWCGIEERAHFQQWKAPVGWHTWQAPTQEQIKARMVARRQTRTTPTAGSAQ
ncbi:hypothetical protein [Streptomyces tanashiensis]|uniref:hypothetical protein n=1 Tax=Streptomyces tanashiensis TaxID=67367 RepID=UPI0033E7A1B3